MTVTHVGVNGWVSPGSLLSGTCAETEPEQSSRTTRQVWGHDDTWRKEQTNFIYDCKQFVLRFFLRICTRLILGLDPQTKPPSMTAHHGLVTSHCITLILRGQTINLLGKSQTRENWGLSSHQPPLVMQYSTICSTNNTKHRTQICT
jgi:hypothetical protein